MPKIYLPKLSMCLVMCPFLEQWEECQSCPGPYLTRSQLSVTVSFIFGTVGGMPKWYLPLPDQIPVLCHCVFHFWNSGRNAQVVSAPS